MNWLYGLEPSPWRDVDGHDTWWGALARLINWTLFSRDDGE